MEKIPENTYQLILLPFLIVQNYVLEIGYKVILYEVQSLIWLGLVPGDQTLHFLVMVMNIFHLLKRTNKGKYVFVIIYTALGTFLIPENQKL